MLGSAYVPTPTNEERNAIELFPDLLILLRDVEMSETLWSNFHTVTMADFNAWVLSEGRTPRDKTPDSAREKF
jgi:hypothetical protein